MPPQRLTDNQFLLFKAFVMKAKSDMLPFSNEDCEVFPRFARATENIKLEPQPVSIFGATAKLNQFVGLHEHAGYLTVRVFVQPTLDYPTGQAFYVILSEETKHHIIMNLFRACPNNATVLNVPDEIFEGLKPNQREKGSIQFSEVKYMISTKTEELYSMIQDSRGTIFERIVACLYYVFPYIEYATGPGFFLITFDAWKRETSAPAFDVPSHLSDDQYKAFFLKLAAYCFMPAFNIGNNIKSQIMKRVASAWAAMNEEALVDGELNKMLESITLQPGLCEGLMSELCGRVLTTNMEGRWNPEMTLVEIDRMSRGDNRRVTTAHGMAIYEQFRMIYKYHHLTTIKFAVEGYEVLKDTRLDASEFFSTEIPVLQEWTNIVREAPYQGLVKKQPTALHVANAPRICCFGLAYHGANLNSEDDKKSWELYNVDGVAKHLDDSVHRGVVDDLLNVVPKKRLLAKKITSVYCTEETYNMFKENWSISEMDYVYSKLKESHPNCAFVKMRKRDINLESMQKFTKEVRPTIESRFNKVWEEIGEKIFEIEDDAKRKTAKRQLAALKNKVRRSMETQSGKFSELLDNVGLSHVTSAVDLINSLDEWFDKASSWTPEEITNGTFSF